MFFAGPVTGLLGGPAAFLEVGFFRGASSLLVVSVAASFFGLLAGGFCSGPVAGLLGRPAAFLELGFFSMGF